MASGFYTTYYDGTSKDLDSIFYKPSGGSGAGALGLIGPNGDLGTLYSDASPLNTKLYIYGNTGEDIGMVRGNLSAPTLVISSPFVTTSHTGSVSIQSEDLGGESTNERYSALYDVDVTFTCSISLSTPANVTFYATHWADSGTVREPTKLLTGNYFVVYGNEYGSLNSTAIGTLTNVQTAQLTFEVNGSGSSGSYSSPSSVNTDYTKYPIIEMWFVATNDAGSVTSVKYKI